MVDLQFVDNFRFGGVVGNLNVSKWHFQELFAICGEMECVIQEGIVDTSEHFFCGSAIKVERGHYEGESDG
jgi:hypothetical protein